ncbi:hypothetical protein chiPu_0017870 [Chiloscyllium punctatum]|uniref:Uncharacterized protein n=1 Tax=Chiloscyllium punctatum TaxID=137246 RepID=A0A401RJE9_CHIPU|nr:hypothetical protein [Chiloscyllium punctatum]
MDDPSESEATIQRKRKSKPGSLRRALSWLRLSGRKKKKSKSEGDKVGAKLRSDSQSSGGVAGRMYRMLVAVVCSVTDCLSSRTD